MIENERIATYRRQILNFFKHFFSSEEAQRFTKHLLQIHDDNITSRSVIVKKSTQPWFAERGEEAVMRKHTAQGTEQKVELARE